MILTVRTDKPEAEIGLYNGTEKVDYITWHAHRQLAETIHQRIHSMLQKHAKEWSDVTGIVFYKGPGSFTGLRIGASVVNALVYSLDVPIIGGTGEKWLYNSIHVLLDGENDVQINPEYGRDAHITKPKK